MSRPRVDRGSKADPAAARGARSGKGFIGTEDPSPLETLTEWEPGDKVHYAYLFPGTRPDRYRVGGRLFNIGDVQCPDPSCACGTANIDVEEILEDREPAPTSPSTEITGSRLLELVAREGVDVSAVENLYRLYRTRYPLDQRLRDRRGRARAAMRPRFDAPLASRTAPAGRNDPCPCGSSKKFKNCCGAAGASR